MYHTLACLELLCTQASKGGMHLHMGNAGSPTHLSHRLKEFRTMNVGVGGSRPVFQLL